MRIAVALTLLSASCSYDWTDNLPAIALVGAPPPSSRFQKLNRLPAGHSSLMQGPDGAPWTAFCEFRGSAGEGRRACRRMHVVRLASPGADELLTATTITVRYRALYLLRDDATNNVRTVVIHRPGDTVADEVAFTMPPGEALLRINSGGDDDVFLYWVLDAATTHYDVFRRDRRYQRRFAVPAGVDGSRPQRTMEFLFTRDGATLVVRGPDAQTVAYSTLDEGKVALGVRPVTMVIDDDRHALLTFGDDGLRSVPLDGGADRVLVPPGTLSSLTLDAAGNAWYSLGGDLYRVPLDGSAAPVRSQTGAARLLALGPHGEIVYSKDPPTRYVDGVGDGWLGEWNFMARGRFVLWNADGTRMHFLESAARIGVVGDLTSIAMPASPGGLGGAPLRLGLNVHEFGELADGRLLAVENHAYAGAWNRLVAIDEASRTARWVVPGADQFFFVPDSGELIVDAISGASGYDVLRVPAP